MKLDESASIRARRNDVPTKDAIKSTRSTTHTIIVAAPTRRSHSAKEKTTWLRKLCQDFTPASETSRQSSHAQTSFTHPLSTPNEPSRCCHEAHYVLRGHSRTATRPLSSLPSRPRPFRSPHAHEPAKPNNHKTLLSHLGAPSLANSAPQYDMRRQHRRSRHLASHRHRSPNSHGTTSSHSAERAEESDRDALSWARLL
jgi:hypothetical protein